MDEQILVIAVALASAIGAPLIQGVKAFYQQITGKPLHDTAALWTAVVVSVILAAAAMGIAGVFSPPYPTTWQEWASLIGGSISSIFAVATVVFKTLIKPAVERQLKQP